MRADRSACGWIPVTSSSRLAISFRTTSRSFTNSKNPGTSTTMRPSPRMRRPSSRKRVRSDFQLFLWGGDTFCGQTDRGVHLLPRVVKNGLQNALLACEMLDELGLTCPCQTADGRGAGALVAALGEKGLSCLADPLAARRQNSGSLGSRCPHALPPSSPSDSSWLQMLFY